MDMAARREIKAAHAGVGGINESES